MKKIILAIIALALMLLVCINCEIKKSNDGTVEFSFNAEETKQKINEKLGRMVDTVFIKDTIRVKPVVASTKNKSNNVVNEATTEQPSIISQESMGFIACDGPMTIIAKYKCSDGRRMDNSEQSYSDKFKYSYIITDGCSNIPHQGLLFHSDKKYDVGDELFIMD